MNTCVGELLAIITKVFGELDIPVSTKRGNNIGDGCLRSIIHQGNIKGEGEIIWIRWGLSFGFSAKF